MISIIKDYPTFIIWALLTVSVIVSFFIIDEVSKKTTEPFWINDSTWMMTRCESLTGKESHFLREPSNAMSNLGKYRETDR